MRAAYVDTSGVLAIYFEEPGYLEFLRALDESEEIFSSNLLEAELRSAMSREGIERPSLDILERFVWVHPTRSLTEEIGAVLTAGYLRGADLWHLACALYLRGSHNDVEVLTLDQRQITVARRLGFSVA